MSSASAASEMDGISANHNETAGCTLAASAFWKGSLKLDATRPERTLPELIERVRDATLVIVSLQRGVLGH